MIFRANTIRRLIYFFLVFLFIFLLVLLFTARSEKNSSNSISNPAIKLTDGWNYRMGDSPFDSAGIPLWTKDLNNNSQWKPFIVPGQPQNENNLKDVWLNVKLPNGDWKDPSIFFKTFEQDFEVYLDGKQIYKYGEIGVSDKTKRLGFPLTIISLPEGYQNKTAFFRLHSVASRNTGLVVSAELASKAEHITQILKNDIDKIIFAFLFIFIGAVAFFLCIIKVVDQKAFLALGFASITIALWIIAKTDIKLIFYDNPRFWYYTIHVSNFLIPVGFLAYIEQIFTSGRFKLIIQKVWQFQIIFALIGLLLDLLNLALITDFIQLYFILLLFYIILGLYGVIQSSAKENAEAKVFFFGVLVISIFGINDFLSVYFRILPWSLSFIQWGMFGFVLSLIFILGMRFIDTYEKIKIYAVEIESKNKVLNDMWKEVKYSRDKLAEWNENLEETVKQKTSAIKNLLNNAGQGFLTFSDDLLINEGYSIECEKIFDKKIENIKFSELIYSKGEEKKCLEFMLMKILNEESEYKKSIYLPLLPDEIFVNNKNVHISYKIIENTQSGSDKILMAILTDITDKRFLENKMEQERKILKMIVSAVTNYNDFIKFVRDYEYFCNTKIYEILESNSTLKSIVFEIFRAIHTFKGSFGQMDMVDAVGKIHDFETKLSEINNNIGEMTLENFKTFISSFNISGLLEKDMGILKQVLGEQYFIHEKALLIDQAKLIEIEKKIMDLLPPSQQEVLLPQIRRLRYRSFKELLNTYPQFVAKLSERLEKSVNPVEIKGKDINVDLEKYRDFAISLVHIFRNIMSHGLESADERILQGKSTNGNVTCRIKLLKGNISLVIGDDGRGIDLNRIKEKALEKGIYDEEILKKLKDSEVLKILFTDGFSLKESSTELSGRGVGLSAVKHELDKLNRSIHVKTTLGKGTEFHFLISKDE